jgi:GTP-binding nuclear protein Ran
MRTIVHTEVKVVLIGDGGVGKSTFVKRFRTNKFDQIYTATLGVEVHRIKFRTNYGTITFNCWDTAGQEKFGGLRDGYYINADAAMIFFDLNSRITYKNLGSWKKSFERTVKDAPIVVVGNKVDIPERKLKRDDVTKPTEWDFPYFETSVRTGLNCKDPFLSLARTLTGNQDLEFI